MGEVEREWTRDISDIKSALAQYYTSSNQEPRWQYCQVSLDHESEASITNLGL